jgi:hypothetical protein
MVDDQQRLFGSSYGETGAPQPCECLRAVHLVYEVPVDVEQACAVWFLVHQVVAPDLVVKGMAHHAGLLQIVCASAHRCSADNQSRSLQERCPIEVGIWCKGGRLEYLAGRRSIWR